MKVWDELTDLEKRAAIARRLGWTHRAYTPHWPTNDGLAFTAVWPKLDSGLLIGKCHDVHGLHRTCGLWEFSHNGFELMYQSTTWADVICRAAYELLPSSRE